jgi:hypothetical protein
MSNSNSQTPEKNSQAVDDCSVEDQVEDQTKLLLLSARNVSLRGVAGQILPPTSLEIALGGLTIITGGDQLAKTALGLILTGRMTGYKGALLPDDKPALKQLRLSSALIDAPKLSEPEEWMSLRNYVIDELKIAGLPHDQTKVVNFLNDFDASEYLHTKMKDLPIGLSYQIQIALIEQRQNKSGEKLVRTCCFVSPDRHDTSIKDWWLPILDLLKAKLGYTLILICQDFTYSYLRQHYHKSLQDLEIARFKIGCQATLEVEV